MSKNTFKKLEKINMLTLKNYERKIKPPFMIHADFENISLPKKTKKIERKMKISMIQVNTKNMLLAVTVISLCV